MVEIFRFKKNNKGFILIATTFITALLLLLSAYVLSFTLTELKISGSQAIATQAYYLAESGVADAIWRIKNDTSWKNSFETNPNWIVSATQDHALYDNGSYEINIVNSGKARGQITVTGKIKRGNSTAQRVIKTSVFKAIGESPLGNVAEYADGNIDISLSILNISGGSLFSNNNVIINSQSTVNVADKISAGGQVLVHNKATTTGIIVENADMLPMPAVSFDEPSDNNSLKKKAGSNVYTEKEFEDLVKANPTLTLNGTTYVTGGISIPHTQTLFINGALVADDDIEIGKFNSDCNNSNEVNISITKPSETEPAGIFSKRKIYFKKCLGKFNADGLIYANDQIDVLSIPNLLNVTGGLISRKLTITSAWQGVNITFNNDNIVSGLGSAIFSPVVTVEHWEEEY